MTKKNFKQRLSVKYSKDCEQGLSIKYDKQVLTLANKDF